MSKLLSVNVGLPREIKWQGKLVRTAIWKHSVPKRVVSRRLNLDGDSQADLKGHGGEQRAVMVYQLEAYRSLTNHLSGWIAPTNSVMADCPGSRRSLFKKMRHNPRYTELLKKMRLPA